MTHVDNLVAHIQRNLGDLNIVHPDAVFQYASLPLCVIDAVFSIGVRYASTERTVKEWCNRYGWDWERSSKTRERTISEFLGVLRPYEDRWENMAAEVFRIHQRTSTTSGILKAEAVYRFAMALQGFRVETFADALQSGLRADIRAAITAIPGQGRGCHTAIFLSLPGTRTPLKPTGWSLGL